MFFTRSMFMVWSLGYIFSQACKSSSQAAAWVRGSMPGWELWSPGFDPIPQPEVTSTPSEACPSSVAVTWDRCSPRCPAWLSKYHQQKHFGSLLSAVQVSLSQGLFPGGEIFLPEKASSWEEEGEGAYSRRVLKGIWCFVPHSQRYPAPIEEPLDTSARLPGTVELEPFNREQKKKNPKN